MGSSTSQEWSSTPATPAGAGGDETTSSAAFSRGVSASTRDVSPT